MSRRSIQSLTLGLVVLFVTAAHAVPPDETAQAPPELPQKVVEDEYNYEAVKGAIAKLNSKRGLGLGARQITVSTVGLVPQIQRLAKEDVHVELAVSLHAASDRVRNVLVPVNRRYPLAKLVPDEPSLEDRTDPVYIGGPVDPHSVQFLIRADSGPEGSLPVLDGVYVGSGKKLLERLTREEEDGGTPFRVFVGYAGWAPGQLENEMSRGGWHVMPADAKSIFERDPADVWSALMRRISPAHGLEARLNAPCDPGSPAPAWPGGSSAWASSP